MWGLAADTICYFMIFIYTEQFLMMTGEYIITEF